jgi:uncharacterized membrane protein SpoIIM required for sporulation
MSKLDRFVTDRENTWAALSRLLAEHTSRRDHLSEDELRWLTRAYRTTAADLATARREFPGHPVVGRLDGLVRHSYGLINRDAAVLDDTDSSDIGAWVGWRAFASRRYWQLIASRPLLLGLCAFFLLAPTILVVAWSRYDPNRAASLLPAGFTGGRDSPGDLGLSVGRQSVFASIIATNNIRVSFLAFAAGITAGIGTGYVLITNGLILGAVIGASINAGQGDAVTALIVPHGVLELSIIIVTAAAGMRMGWALVDPGTERRSVSLIREARVAIMIIIGTIPWFIVAGLVEGFYTPAGFGVGPAILVGVSLGVLYWGLVVWRGRGPLRPPTARLDKHSRRLGTRSRKASRA